MRNKLCEMLANRIQHFALRIHASALQVVCVYPVRLARVRGEATRGVSGVPRSGFAVSMVCETRQVQARLLLPLRQQLAATFSLLPGVQRKLGHESAPRAVAVKQQDSNIHVTGDVGVSPVTATAMALV